MTVQKKFLGYMRDIACEGCINFVEEKCTMDHKITVETKLFFCKQFVDKNVIYDM